MALVNKRVTSDELAQRLVNSRKVMKMVNDNNYEKGNIDESMIVSNAPDEVLIDEPIREKKILSKNLTAAPTDIQKVHESKLPDAIKRAMIDHPIPQISLNETIDMKLVDKAKKLMEQDGSLSTTSKSSSKSPMKDFGYPTLNESKLEKLIENAVRKVLDEKLNQILTAQQLGTINENLVLKVGNSIFSGKITKVKNSK
jgi:hypothetical protein